MEEVAEKVQIPVTERNAIPHQIHKAITINPGNNSQTSNSTHTIT